MRLVRSVAVMAMAVGVSAGLVAGAGPAVADTPGCVTRGEFRHVSDGMSIDRVHKIFDTNGDLIVRGGGAGIPRWKELRYVRCDNDPLFISWAIVHYVERSDGTWRVTSKRWN